MTRARGGSVDGMRQAALWRESAKPGAANRLVQGDNLHVMRALPDECVDLIYIDPPFFSGRRHRPEHGDARAAAGFSDIWTGGLRGYLVWLSARLYEMRRLLRPAGTIWLHLDWHAVHYVKIEADRLFGYGSFRNQVIWAYGATARGAKAVSGQLPRNHDIILVYAKGTKPVYHPVFSERLIPLAAIGRAGYRIDEQGRVFKTAPRGDYTDASIARLEREGRVHRTRTGSVRVKYFLERRGEYVVERRMLGDVWTAIPDAMHLGRERLGYPTQKPEALLETIIRCGTNPGDVVADFFCGSGTTAAVAQRLGRRWVACDDSAEAIALTVARLERLAAVEHGPLTAPAFSVEHMARAADV